MKTDNKKKIEKELQKAMALNILRVYCKENCLSFEKLEKEMFELSYDECGFFHQNEVIAQGLTNDMETMPKPILIIKMEDGHILIEQTRYTNYFLGIE